MKRGSAIAAVVLLIGLVVMFVLYISRGTPQPTVSPPSAERQNEAAALNKQIAVLEERVNTLEERLAKPRSLHGYMTD